jgi:hypothetical protein
MKQSDVNFPQVGRLPACPSEGQFAEQLGQDQRRESDQMVSCFEKAR